MSNVITTDQNIERSVRNAAVVAGLAVLVMAFTVPIVEFYILPKLIDYENARLTHSNIKNHPYLFSTAIFIHFLSVLCDVVSAWALYLFFRPVRNNIALLASWIRLVYAGFNVVALFKLVEVVSLTRTNATIKAISHEQTSEYVLHCVRSFHLQWKFGLIFFGIYLLFLSYLIYCSGYVPKFLGALMAAAAIGYIIDDLKYFYFPEFDTGYLGFTILGELIFTFW
ncbi:MAG: DUF4386 domain-containing protein, partial [Sphingobacteriales bacterium]